MHNILKQQQCVHSILINCLENTYIYRKCASFLGTFILSQKAPVSLIMSASVTMNDPSRFSWNLILETNMKICQTNAKTKIMSTLHEDLSAFILLTGTKNCIKSISLRKSCRMLGRLWRCEQYKIICTSTTILKKICCYVSIATIAICTLLTVTCSSTLWRHCIAVFIATMAIVQNIDMSIACLVLYGFCSKHFTIWKIFSHLHSRCVQQCMYTFM